MFTIDVEAPSPSLNKNDCKKHCTDERLNQQQKGVTLTRSLYLILISLTLNKNFVECEIDMYFQQCQIKMGSP